MEILQELVKHNDNIVVYDPKAMENARKIIGEKVHYAADAYQAAENADILVVLTEWEEFRQLDLDKIKSKMRQHQIMDLRNMLDPALLKTKGFACSGIGR